MAEIESASDELIAYWRDQAEAAQKHMGKLSLVAIPTIVLLAVLARLRKAERERDEAREALAPFAEAANCFDNYSAKMDPSNWFAYGGTTSANGSVGAITVADLRRARATQGGENG